MAEESSKAALIRKTGEALESAHQDMAERALRKILACLDHESRWLTQLGRIAMLGKLAEEIRTRQEADQPPTE